MLRLGRLLRVGFRGSRSGKAAQCLKCLKAQRPDNFWKSQGQSVRLPVAIYSDRWYVKIFTLKTMTREDIV